MYTLNNFTECDQYGDQPQLKLTPMRGFLFGQAQSWVRAALM